MKGLHSDPRQVTAEMQNYNSDHRAQAAADSLADQLVGSGPVREQPFDCVPSSSSRGDIEAAMIASQRFTTDQIRQVTSLPARERENLRKSMIRENIPTAERKQHTISLEESLSEQLIASHSRRGTVSPVRRVMPGEQIEAMKAHLRSKGQ